MPRSAIRVLGLSSSMPTGWDGRPRAATAGSSKPALPMASRTERRAGPARWHSSRRWAWRTSTVCRPISNASVSTWTGNAPGCCPSRPSRIRRTGCRMPRPPVRGTSWGWRRCGRKSTRRPISPGCSTPAPARSFTPPSSRWNWPAPVSRRGSTSTSTPRRARWTPGAATSASRRRAGRSPLAGSSSRPTCSRAYCDVTGCTPCRCTTTCCPPNR